MLFQIPSVTPCISWYQYPCVYPSCAERYVFCVFRKRERIEVEAVEEKVRLKVQAEVEIKIGEKVEHSQPYYIYTGCGEGASFD